MPLATDAAAALTRALSGSDLRALRDVALLVEPDVPDATLAALLRALGALPSLCALRVRLGVRTVGGAEPFLDLARAAYSLQRLEVEAGELSFDEQTEFSGAAGGWADGELERARAAALSEDVLRGIDIELRDGCERLRPRWRRMRVNALCDGG